jgi:hypothetical protein
MSTVKAPSPALAGILPQRVSQPLPKALVAVLEAARDPADRERLSAFFASAARAIDALGDLDLTQYEPGVSGAADLSAWEAVAPIIACTLADVNALLTAVDQQIPEPELDADELDGMDIFGGALDDGAGASGPSPADDSPEAKIRDAMAAIHGIASVLRMEMDTFSRTMRNPQVMADAWNLLDHLEAFRGKFRAGIGEMVYSAASALRDIPKDEVVPGYREDIARGIGLRRAIALLAPWITRENDVAQKAAPSDGYTIRRQATKIGRLLDKFATSPAWKALRAADKKSLIKLRVALQSGLDDPGTYPADLRKTLEGLDRFLESMAVINHRETLIVHDRGALGRLAQTLQATRAASQDGDDAAARLLLKEALDLGWTLIGRDLELDEALIRARSLDLAELDADDVALWAQTLAEQVAAVPVP